MEGLGEELFPRGWQGCLWDYEDEDRQELSKIFCKRDYMAQGEMLEAVDGP